MTAKDVADALRRDYIRRPEMPAGLFIEEIGAPDGTRRADVLWIPNHGQGIIGHEIKVSRSDVQAELLDLAKAESWKRYCRQWWLVVSDEKLVDGLDIPGDWGIKTPPTAANRRQFKVIRDAPKLSPTDVTPALHRIATYMAMERHRREWDDTQHKHEVQRLEARVEQVRLGLAGDAASRVFAEVSAELSRRKFWLPLKSDEIVEAIISAYEVKEIRRDLDIIARERLRDIEKALYDLDSNWAVKKLKEILREEVAA